MELSTFVILFCILAGIVAAMFLLKVVLVVARVIFKEIDEILDSKAGKFLLLAAGAVIARAIIHKRRTSKNVQGVFPGFSQMSAQNLSII